MSEDLDVKKAEVCDGGKGDDVSSAECAPMQIKQVPKRYRIRFSSDVTVTEMAAFLETILLVQGEEVVRKLSLYPNISFVEVGTGDKN